MIWPYVGVLSIANGKNSNIRVIKDAVGLGCTPNLMKYAEKDIVQDSEILKIRPRSPISRLGGFTKLTPCFFIFPHRNITTPNEIRRRLQVNASILDDLCGCILSMDYFNVEFWSNEVVRIPQRDLNLPMAMVLPRDLEQVLQ